MSLSADQLFALLPAVYRTRDAGSGGPLQALFAVMAAQSAVVEDNIKQLYDDQFIETCAPWVIPYIGDLIGYNSIYEIKSTSHDSRAEVANTIGYRRRKGTLIALEQLATDVSGRVCVAVEEFKRLIVTESMRDVRPRHAATADLRRTIALDRLGTPFDTVNRTVDVRRIAPRLRAAANPDPTPLDIALHGPGHVNIPDVAVWLWRWQSQQVVTAPAYPLGGGRYKFSPLGQDIPLFARAPQRTPFDHLNRIADVPQPIYRDEFMRNVAAFYGPSFELIDDDGKSLPAGQIQCANLADRPGGGWCNVQSGFIAIDPELGRIRFAADVKVPTNLRVTYCYGFPAKIGGGPYDRSTSLSQLAVPPANFKLVGSPGYPTLASAIAWWNALAPGSSGIIVLQGFEQQTIDLTAANAIKIPPGSNLTIAAAEPNAAPGAVVWNNSCVTLTGNIEVSGLPGTPGADGAPPPGGQLLISGLWIAGRVIVSGSAVSVQIADSTLVPGVRLTGGGDPVHSDQPSILVTAKEADVTLNRGISGPIAADPSGTTRICASILDATSPYAVAYAGPDLASAGADLHVEDSTIVGKVRMRTLKLASNTIFHASLASHDPWDAPVWASRLQAGCVRFCSLPFASITPRRYRCLPADAASEAALEPTFITLRYGEPSYALLRGDVPMAVWRGADNGSQIGVYGQIQETEAVCNVQLRAPEYLPATLECGVFLVPSRPAPRVPAAQLYYHGSLAAYGGDEHHPGIGAGLI